MNPPALLEARKMIRSMNYERWQGVAKTALGLPTAQEISQLISEEYDRNNL